MIQIIILIKMLLQFLHTYFYTLLAHTHTHIHTYTHILKLNTYISTIPLLTKILEKTVYIHLSHYLTENILLNIRRNAFRKIHSTETTVLSFL